MQGFYMRSTCSEVLLVLRRRMRDDQVAYQLLGLGLDFKTQSFLSIHAKRRSEIKPPRFNSIVNVAES